jgi:flagellar motor switch protein FliN/FliY
MSDMSNPPKLDAETAAEIVDLRAAPNYDLLAAIPLRVSVEVGSASLRLSTLLTLGEGSVVELDRATSDLLEIFANGTLLARGEVVKVGDNYGIRIVEITSSEYRLDSFDRRGK